MNLLTYTMNKALVITLEGEFDAHAVTDLRAQFDTFSSLDNDVLIDMSAVHFIDSSGVGALVFLYKRLKERGYVMSVLNVNGQPKDLFDLLHLNKTIQCFDSVKSFLGVKDNFAVSARFA